ncbi:Rabenosyn-5 [Drechslerella dactyloides]|uniref:Rabenosyn-5 n=1 Tax=Drechslerella dactyloides TaxID=74499 RepID=A0AAD6NF07_DREDA|nr:Rabenosyn-5 [Drechslerella dactyloides]
MLDVPVCDGSSSPSAASFRTMNHAPRSPAPSATTVPTKPKPGGRVLGRPLPNRGLSPALSNRPQLAVSPSESSASFASQSSFGIATGGGIGGHARNDSGNTSGFSAPLGNGTGNGSAGMGRYGEEIQDSGRMICPICEMDMLNRHLDDDHKEVESVEKDDISSWFQKNLLKAKQFQPVALLNQKLKGLDVFESNDNFHPTIHSTPSIPANSSQTTVTPSIVARERDPEEYVTRQHWQRAGQRDLSPIRDHTKEFLALRRKTVDRQHLETSRLDKRLTKLTQVLTDPAAAETINLQQQNSSKIWPVNLNGLRNPRKLLEQSVVTWEDDSKVPGCPFCKQTFTNFSLRKHHCRLCGRVVCGDSRTGCSKEIGLNVNVNFKPPNSLTEKMEAMALDVRMCRDCSGILFSKRDFAEEVSKKPPDQRNYETMVQFEKGIITMLPRFQKLLSTLQDDNKPPTVQQRSEASKTRKRLLDAFTQYDTAAKRILNLPTESPMQQQLQRSIYMYSVEFLQTHMFPLKALPKILKQTKAASKLGVTGHISHHKSLNSISQASIDDASSVVSSNPEADAEEKLLKEQLAVLEEQKFFVGEMIANAKAGRKFEEIGALAQSLGDLDREIEKVEGQIKDFEKRNPIW